MFELDTAKIKSLLFARGLTLRGLAQAAKLTETTAAKVVQGSKANARTISKLAAALGVKGEDLIMEAN